jgi:hypothetical protein
MLHIHFGAGNFGLGFAVWLLSEAGCRSVVLNRAPVRPKKPHFHSADVEQNFAAKLKDYENKRLRDAILRREKLFSLQFLDQKEAEPTEVPIERFYYYDRPSEFDRLLAAISENPENLFITTSVKARAAITDICPLIDQLARASRSLTFVAAFENAFRSVDIEREFRQRYQNTDSVFFPDAVVDRICSRMLFAQSPNGDGIVSVQVESFASLALEELAGADALYAALQPARKWITVTKETQAHRAVKLGMTNAAHIFLAGDAQFYDMPLLKLYLTLEDFQNPEAPSLHERQRHLASLLVELRIGVLAYWGERLRSDSAKRTMEMLMSLKRRNRLIQRFTLVDDDVDRVLSRLKAPSAADLHTMSDFLRSMLDKIQPPVEGYLKLKKKGPFHATQSFLRIAHLVSIRKFVGAITHH